MATNILMPALSPTMTEGTLARWLKKEGDKVNLIGDDSDGTVRRVEGLPVIDYEIPPGSLGMYYPESNVLISLDHYALESKVPAAKSVPVRLEVAS